MLALFKSAPSIVSVCSKAPIFNQQLVAGLKTTSTLFLGRYSENRGGGRPLPHYVPKPIPGRYGWKVIFPESKEYTIKPLKVVKLGGRNEANRVAVRTLGGGHKKKYRWLDNKRHAKPGEVIQERVLQVRYDPCRTAYIALVACGENVRWILPSQDMKVGDLISTYGDIPRIPVQAKVGDSHPIGALPLGSIMHHVEVIPGEGGIFCMSAGAGAQLIRKIGDMCVVKLPSKREISINEKCMVVVGTVLNEGCRRPIGSAERNRHLGRRPRSGKYHKKDGYCGRKIHPKPPLQIFKERSNDPFELYPLRMFAPDEAYRTGKKKQVLLNRRINKHVDWW